MYELGDDGYVRSDPTLNHPRCVFNLLKLHYSRYTPGVVSEITGTPEEDFLTVCEMIADTAAPDRTMTVMYALGWTQHSKGSQMIRCAAMLQLMLGNIGQSGGGMNALRGHSNIQGLTDLGLLSDLLPGYLTLPNETETEYGPYIDSRAFKPLRPNQMSYWQNYSRFHVSLMKAWFGDAATPQNDWCFDWLPKLDRVHDVLQVFDDMHQGDLNGYICQGFNPLAAFPDKRKLGEALANLDYLVIIDPLETETSEFWKDHGDFNPADSESIATEVFRLPSTCFAEEHGSLVNSGRWLQWHWKGAEPPGDAKGDAEIIAGIFLKLREMYRQEGGAFPEPILNMTWNHLNPDEPSAEELAREFNGKALDDLTDPEDPSKILRRAGQQLSSFGELRDDGSTACGCWLFCGAWPEEGNLMARRDNSDPSGLGNTLGWAFSWPANRRILYNRASADPEGNPWDPHRRVISWDGDKWSGIDVPDFSRTSAPAQGMGPFIMNPEGVARPFAVDKMAEGPFPEHYEPFESPLASNPMHPEHAAARNNPAARVFKRDLDNMGDAESYPYVATTYRLTEHFHYWTKHVEINAILQPEQFIEIGASLAAEKRIAPGDMIRVSSKRGEIVAKAVVTKRLRALTVQGRTVHHIGLPIHWGFKGHAKPGYLTNTLTPFVGDANTNTPEFKAFLVNVEKA